MSTPTFQRLHNVNQLGLTHLVFPGANYSRFAHSLGTCHIAGRLLDALLANKPGLLNDREVQLYRLAALLHDVGHYPFSHSMEHAIGEHYPGAKFLADGKSSEGSARETVFDLTIDTEPPSYDHELLGKRIVRYDKAIAGALKRHGFESAEVVDTFGASRPGSIIHMISSDLDCDRLDYLMRTAHHAGMPYGAVDIEYIVGQATVDDGGRFCFRRQALKAADHLLISRYFDYQQVPFHKTVVAIELLLESALKGLFELGYIRCSAADMLRRIENGEWTAFDDQWMISLFRRFIADEALTKDKPELALQIRSILQRSPPKLVGSFDRLANRGEESETHLHQHILDKLNSSIPMWAENSGIPEGRWMIWENRFALTKSDSRFSLSALRSKPFDELEQDRAVRLLTDRTATAGSSSKTVMEFDESLMKPLASQEYHAIRVYVLLDPLEDADKQRRTARDELHKKFCSISYFS